MNSVSAPDTTARGTIERPLIAIVVDTSVSFDREIIAGAAQYAREVGDWQLYVEEEHGHRLPNLGTWQGHGILASFDDPDVVRSILAAGLPTVAVGGMGCHDPASDIPRIARPMAVPQRSPGRRAARKSRVPGFRARTSGTRNACLPPWRGVFLTSAQSLSEAGRLAALE
jgi:hypothetical protein